MESLSTSYEREKLLALMREELCSQRYPCCTLARPLLIGRTSQNVAYYINNRQLLEWAQKSIGVSIGIDHDSYQLVLRGKGAVEAIRKLPLMHEEKVAAKKLILRRYDNGGIGLEALRDYREHRRRIIEEVRLCTLQARLEFIRKHSRPHRYDPDQTIPRI